MKWMKTEISNEIVKTLCGKYGVDPIAASIMVRRNIVSGKDVWPFMEESTRYLHNPFLFSAMEDVVDRILDAVNENEGVPPKVLVFGDRDVDGITAALIMKGALKNMGCDVICQVPTGKEPYGITAAAVDDFAANGGTLIVTVDCGISCAAAIDRAAEHGIDVIVTDHHNVTDVLPNAVAVIDPKIDGCGYPFSGLSGAGVALKVSYALRFSRLGYYKNDITMLDAHYAKSNKSITVECIKTRNMVIKSRLTETFKAGSSIADSRLVSFLTGQHIFVWNAKQVSGILQIAFGKGVEFALHDLKTEVAKTWKQFANKTIEDIRAASKVLLYGENKDTVDALYNVFVTWAMSLVSKSYKDETDDLCLAALSSMADVMPMADENRIIVKNAVRNINKGKVRRGIAELMAHQSLMPALVSARDLSWTVIPALNAAGRMGNSQMALALLDDENAAHREKLSQEMVDVNEERKSLVNSALSFTRQKAKESLDVNWGKIIFIADGRISKGVTGLVAARFAEQYGVPAIVIDSSDDVVTGSMRSTAGLSCTEFLSHFDKLFIDYGGHNSAAGFSLAKDILDEFRCKVKEYTKEIKMPPLPNEINVDAEIPSQYVSSLLKVVDFFSPFGTGNEELIFMTKGLAVCSATVLGKTERQHLKLILDCGAVKYPAMIWGGGELLDREIKTGDVIDVLYSMNRNTFNGMSTPQMIIKDWRKTNSANG